MKGFTGVFLNVYLDQGKIERERASRKLLSEYLGGYGLGARILYSRLPPGIDPLGPENILSFTTGPLVATPAISGLRFTVCAKSPLTQTWGDSNCGGYFGPALRQAGFDAVFIYGQSQEPVYLLIEKGKAKILKAEWLWGKDTAEVQDLIQDKLGKGFQTAAIGPAGEQLSKIACIINDKGRAAGRSGLGAVMGSKRLKAIAVLGDMQIPLADEGRMKDLRKKQIKLLDTRVVKNFRKYGTIANVASSAFLGDSPILNWRGVGKDDFPQAERISDDNILEYEYKKYNCWRCPIACSGYYRVKEGPYAVRESHKPEYETFAMFGNNLLNDNLESIILINDLCNRYGVDTISCGATIAFAFECFERGIIDEVDTDGLSLNWGDHTSILSLTKKTLKREGFGALLADGVKVAAERIGRGSEKYAIHVKGQELPAHDPRFAPSWSIYYCADATPGRHTQTGFVMNELASGYPGLEFPQVDKYVYGRRGYYAARTQNILHSLYACGICMFALTKMDIQIWLQQLEAATGEEYSLERMEEIGARIATIRQSFNCREGIEVSTVDLPGRTIGHPPQTRGPMAGISLPLRRLIREYYVAQGWDERTGVPLPERIKELGLEALLSEV